FVAFGPVVGSVFIDDVIVERDALSTAAAVPAPPERHGSAPESIALPTIANVLQPESLVPQGRFIEVTVPDTLDLAARAEISLNALMLNVNPEDAYAVYESFQFGPGQPAMTRPGWFINPWSLFALPYVRTMCGSRAGLDTELGMMRSVLEEIQPDGRMTF